MAEEFSTTGTNTQAYGTAPVKTPVQPQTQPAQAKPVDLTATNPNAVTESPVEETEVKHFDSDTLTLPSNYISKYMSNINKLEGGITNSNGDIRDLNNSIKDQALLTDSFKRGILHNQEDKSSHQAAQNLFATLDTTNYKYSHHPILGNIRTQIDENGKEIGLPEAIDKNGMPITYTDKFPTLLA